MLHLADLSADNFFDDILVHSASWSDHLYHVRNVLDRLKSYGLTARSSKILAGSQSLEFLGHVVGSGVLSPDESKIKKDTASLNSYHQETGAFVVGSVDFLQALHSWV